MENKSSQELCDQLLAFVHKRSPAYVAKTLRCILLFYWNKEKEEGSPCEYHQCLFGILQLLELLDAAEKYKRSQSEKNILSI